MLSESSMDKQRIALTGAIDSIQRQGQVYIYTGTLLGPGMHQGIDGHKIRYEDTEDTSIKDVFEQAAPTFDGRQLVYGHYDQSRKSVKGFNLVTWVENGRIRNKGLIGDSEVIKLIEMGEFDLGQSMEAWVWTDNQMRAKKIVGDVVAIGIRKPAYGSAFIEEGKGVKLQMGNEFTDKVKAKLEELITGDDKETKINTVMELFKDVFVVPGAEKAEKLVIMSGDRFTELKAEAEAGKGSDTLKAQLEELRNEVKSMREQDRKSEKDLLVGEIQVLNGAFKSDEYLEGVTDHALQMRMLKAYYEKIKEFEPMLPAGRETRVDLAADEEAKIFEEMTGTKLSRFLSTTEES